MNDAAVQRIWEWLERLEDAVEMCEDRINFLEGQVRARLKEEAEERALRLHQD